MAKQSRVLPRTLYTAEQTGLLDRLAIEGGVPGFVLMQRAARTAFGALLQRWPEVRSLSILCGRGNNGGDGLVMAVLAARQGLQVQLLTMGDDYEAQLRGEALEAWQMVAEQGIPAQCWAEGIELSGELVVDAMLGTGLRGAVRGDYAAAIRQLNGSGLPVLAVDIPSGLCADSGAVLAEAVRADMTVSFIGLKRGLLTHQAVDHVGELLFDDLRVEPDVYEQLPVSLFRSSQTDLKRCLPARNRSAHKGSNGHVLVVGGDRGMGGAALIAAQAAARSGAGLVTLATRAEHITAALVRCPEVMSRAVRGVQDLQPLLERADVVVIGPGLGQSAWSDQLLQQVLKSDRALVVDADALNMLCSNPVLQGIRRDNWILTPHPGEAGRLLDESVPTLQADRFAAVRRLQQRYGGVAVLKGAGSLTDDGITQYLCSAGNPGMACGGMGDLLAGITGALKAQGLSLLDAAQLAVYTHASAADAVAHQQGERGMLASDLLEQLPGLLNGSDE